MTREEKEVAWERINDQRMDDKMTRLEKDVAMALILEIYDTHSAGCCWHIVLDDGNCEQGNVDFCMGAASREQHMACMLLGGILANKTRGEVRALVDKAHRKMNQAFERLACAIKPPKKAKRK